MNNFRTYQLSVQFYRECQTLKLPYHLKNQLLRAASSSSLNLIEGSANLCLRDKKRFYEIAYGSIKESMAALDLAGGQYRQKYFPLADSIAAHIYKLIKSLGP